MELVNLNNDLIKKKVKFSSTSLQINQELTDEEFYYVFEHVGKMNSSTQFWIGDIACYGDKININTDSKVYDGLEISSGYKRNTIRDFKYICENVNSSIRIDELSFNHHRLVAKFSFDIKIQKSLLVWAKKNNLSVKEFKEYIDEEYPEELQQLPEGKYDILYYDPPWEYDNTGFDMSANKKYITMSIEQMINQKDELDRSFKDLKHDNSVIFMWSTNPFLEDAIYLMGQWGFEYKTNIVWVKKNHTAGFWVFGQHELLLIGSSGTMPEISEKPKSKVVTAENKVHSKKPPLFYDMIENMFPKQKWVELFARNNREGWTSWGNEISKD